MDNTPVLIILAGGRSTRMGFPKGLLDFHGNYWILEQISRYKYVNNAKVYIGLGYDYKNYLAAIPWFEKAKDNYYEYQGVEVKVVINNQPQFGAFSTLQTVLNSIDKEYSVLVQPVDVPLLNKQSLASIINENHSVVIPKCSDKNGHPVKLKPKFWNRLLKVDISSNDARLDLQIKKTNNESVTYVKVLDSSVYQNINTKEKWTEYLKI